MGCKAELRVWRVVKLTEVIQEREAGGREASSGAGEV